MSLVGMQTVVARLLLDVSFRDAVLADPALPTDMDVTPQEWQQVLALPMDRIIAYSQSLYAKRVFGYKKLLPLTHTYLGEAQFARLGRTYCATHIKITDSDGAFWDDANGFADWLRAQSTDLTLGEYLPYVLDVDQVNMRIVFTYADESMAFQPKIPAVELTQEYVLASRPVMGSHHAIIRLPVDLSALLTRASEGAALQLTPTPRQPFLLVKQPGQAHPRVIRVNESAVRFLQLLDGNRTGQEALDEMEIGVEVAGPWVKLLLSVYSIGLVRFDP